MGVCVLYVAGRRGVPAASCARQTDLRTKPIFVESVRPHSRGDVAGLIPDGYTTVTVGQVEASVGTIGFLARNVEGPLTITATGPEKPAIRTRVP